MTKILDTNVLIRHFTGQPPELAHRATEYLSKARPQELLLLDLHVAECVYVLEGSYPRSKPETSRLINSLVGFAAIQFEREEIIQRALNLYIYHNMDFGDA
ncbi:MAG: PIN domain-containing protein [Candidatus Dormibacteraceae bacterium]